MHLQQLLYFFYKSNIFMLYTINYKGQIQQSYHLYKLVKMNGIFANYL